MKKVICLLLSSSTIVYAPSTRPERDIKDGAIEMSESNQLYIPKLSGKRTLKDVYKEADVDGAIAILEAFKSKGKDKTDSFKKATQEVVQSVNWDKLSQLQQRKITAIAHPLNIVVPVYIANKKAFRTLQDVYKSVDADDMIQILKAYKKAQYDKTQEFRDAVKEAINSVNWNHLSKTQQTQLETFARDLGLSVGGQPVVESELLPLMNY
jgi:RNA polymerase-interacting CarD/CdnL/TRCF family regulator